MPRILSYLSSREIGKESSNSNVPVTESITSNSNHRPLFAETSISSKTTYLIRLNCDSKYLAAAHGNKTVAIYDSITGEYVASCQGHERHPWTLAFHPNHPYLLASGCLDGSLRLWDLSCLSKQSSSDVPCTVHAKKVWNHIGAVASLDFHPVHPILVAAWTQEVAFYDWVSGRSLSVWRFVSDHSRVRWVKFSPNGTLLYTATANPPCHGVSKLGVNRNDFLYNVSNIKAQEMPRQLLDRSEILDYLIKQDSEWFKLIGVCVDCVHRLLVWIGSFGSEFPSTNTDSNQGLYKVKEALQKSFSHVPDKIPLFLAKLINGNSPVFSDPLPSSVAVIEDLPAREFLKSRGSYCSTKSPAHHVGGPGLCCGGHACDLVITHRELMRYSLCRKCLNSFWKWLTDHIDWWSEPETISTKSFNETDVEHSQDAYGICLQCKTGVQTPSSPGNRARQQNHLPKSACDLISNRLRNANSTSGITHSTPEIIGSEKLDQLLIDSLKRAKEDSYSFDSYSDTDEDSSNDSCDLMKRRRMHSSDYGFSDDDDLHASFEDIAKEAAELARQSQGLSPRELRKHYVHFNIALTHPTQVVTNENDSLNAFSYVGAGWKHLQTFVAPISQQSSNAHSKQSAEEEESGQGNAKKASVCCSCGRLVSRTFPVDPQSSLSQAVCADIVLVNNGSGGTERTVTSLHKSPRGLPRTGSGSNLMHVGPLGAHISPISTDVAGTSSNAAVQRSAQSSLLTSQNGVMYLVQNMGVDSVYRRMERSITDAVVELMVDEHGGSTTTFKETTYRVCRWELNLCGADSSCSLEASVSASNDGETYVPMPANIAVSYHRNNLIIPHSKIFNDSSIQLSKCGRLLAAIVVPKVDKTMMSHAHSTGTAASSEHDTFLAVYRLEPSSKRGQCLFGRRFSVMSPICVDFSPSSEYLIVGFATYKIPFNVSPEEQRSMNPLKLAPIARVFRLSCKVDHSMDQKPGSSTGDWQRGKVLHRVLEEVSCIQHPSLTGMSSSAENEPDPTAQLPPHTQQALTLPMSISVNSILWNPQGGVIYGTTKGLIVILAPRLTREPVTAYLPARLLRQLNEESYTFMEPVGELKTRKQRTSHVPATNPLSSSASVNVC